jgi:REP element-mobilizing transposase RayT
VDKDHIHLLVQYEPKISVLEIVRLLKQFSIYHIWRKHDKYEFKMMLEKIGFREIFVHGDLSNEEVKDRHETMVFRARK